MNILTTICGECFGAVFQNDTVNDGRDGVRYCFRLDDLRHERGTLDVSMFLTGTEKVLVPDCERRVETVGLNVIRRAFDSGTLSFENKQPSELALKAAHFGPQRRATDEAMRDFIKFSGYWVGFRRSPSSAANLFVDFSSVEDFEYLGAQPQDMGRNLRLLTEEGYFRPSTAATFANPLRVEPTAKLIREIEKRLGESNTDVLGVAEIHMTTEIDWSRFNARHQLSEVAKQLVREVAVRFIKEGVGSSDEWRLNLGRDRHTVRDLVASGYLLNVSGKYYPAFPALFFVPPNLRSQCLSNVQHILDTLKLNYKRWAHQKVILKDVEVASKGIPQPMTDEEVRIGANFLRDFPHYTSNLDGTADDPVSGIHLVENILDFENVADAWDEEVKRRLPVTTTAPSTDMQKVEVSENPRRVFVVHGRDERLRAGMFAFLRALGLDPIEWTKAIQLTGNPSAHISEILTAAFRHAQAVLVLLTPDDEARLRNDLLKPNDPDSEGVMRGQARPNVLFEAGMAFASHEKRTVLVEIGRVRGFSDIAGRHVVRMDNSSTKRQEIAIKLEMAGCPVDRDGADWHTAGDLTPPREGGNAPPSVPTTSAESAQTRLQSAIGPTPIIVEPISRSTARHEYILTKADNAGVLIQLPGGNSVRIPKDDYIETWDDSQAKPKLILTRKYFQGYFPGHESATEYLLKR